jgi:NAD(P)-dependent dehydrogenase (short-subunit alcohol dehydrogenase family)
MGNSKSRLEAAKKVNSDVGSLANRNAVVVGGTSGIGKAIALRLAQQGSSVTIVGRSQIRGDQIVNEMQKVGSPAASFKFIACNAMLMKNVAQTAHFYMSNHQRLDFLVFCQTIATTQNRTLTPEGIDEKLSLNYYSRVQFVKSFAPLLTSSSDHLGPRVLSVLSGGVHNPYKDYKTDPELSKNYSLSNAANVAGFYNDLAVDYLSQQYPQVAFLHAAPGFVETNWGTELNPALRFMIRGLQKSPLAKKADECAEYMSLALLSPAYKLGFHILDEYGEPTKVTSAHSVEAREFVKTHTDQLLAQALASSEPAIAASAAAASVSVQSTPFVTEEGTRSSD